MTRARRGGLRKHNARRDHTRLDEQVHGETIRRKYEPPVAVTQPSPTRASHCSFIAATWRSRSVPRGLCCVSKISPRTLLVAFTHTTKRSKRGVERYAVWWFPSHPNARPEPKPRPPAPRAHLRVAVVPPHANPPDVRGPQPSPRRARAAVAVAAAAAVRGLGEAAVGLVQEHPGHAIVV